MGHAPTNVKSASQSQGPIGGGRGTMFTEELPNQRRQKDDADNTGQTQIGAIAM